MGDVRQFLDRFLKLLDSGSFGHRLLQNFNGLLDRLPVTLVQPVSQLLQLILRLIDDLIRFVLLVDEFSLLGNCPAWRL